MVALITKSVFIKCKRDSKTVREKNNDDGRRALKSV